MIVYIVTNKIDGKQYVGQHSGDDLNTYWQYNLNCALVYNLNHKPYLYAAIRKHGPENFEIKPLIIVGTKWEMDYYEKGLIKAFNTKAPNGYNLTDGGDGTVGYVHSEEAKIKISNSHTGEKNPMYGVSLSGENHHMFGKHHSEETKQKLSSAGLGNKNSLGVKHSEETKKKLSVSRTGEKNGMFGRKHSEETKKKMSAAVTRYWEIRRLASLQSKIAP